MKKLENLLAENMRRFGTKNLNEDDDQNNNGYPDDSESVMKGGTGIDGIKRLIGNKVKQFIKLLGTDKYRSREDNVDWFTNLDVNYLPPQYEAALKKLGINQHTALVAPSKLEGSDISNIIKAATQANIRYIEIFDEEIGGRLIIFTSRQ
jgi:hypothetical protein